MIIALQIVETWRPLETVENHALQLFLRSTSVLFSCIITKRDDYKTKVKQKSSGLSPRVIKARLYVVSGTGKSRFLHFWLRKFRKMNSEFRYRVISTAIQYPQKHEIRISILQYHPNKNASKNLNNSWFLKISRYFSTWTKHAEYTHLECVFYACEKTEHKLKINKMNLKVCF